MPDLYPVTGDALSEAELSNWLNQSNLVNYVESGSYTVNHTNEEVTADASVAYIRDTGGDLYKVEPDQKTLALPDQAGTNYLYITFDPTASDPDASPDWEISSTQGGPADPKLLRATIDASADTDTSKNDNPSTNHEAVTTDQVTINEQAARIYATSDQSIANASATTVAFDSSDDYSSGDVLTIDTANNKITIEVAGVYLVRGSLTYDAPGGGTRFDGYVIVGGTTEDRMPNTAGANDRTSVRPSAVVKVTSPPTDVTLSTFQSSGGSIDTFGFERHVNLDVARLG